MRCPVPCHTCARAGPKHSSIGHDLSTSGEAGQNDLPACSGYGILALAATDIALVNKLYADSAQVLATADIRARVPEQSLESRDVRNPVRFAECVKSETAYWE